MKNIFKTCLILSLALAYIMAFYSQAEALDKASVGNVSVNLAAPEGLARVDGLAPAADAYIKKLEPKFKLRILAVYADKNDWKTFAEKVENGQEASIPRLAMICVPQKMGRKKFNVKAIRKEFKTYASWFSLAANNRPTAVILTSQANSKLKEIMGVDLNFIFKTGPHTRVISETSNSISMAARTSFKINSKTTEGLLCATALGVSDKLIYSGYFEEAGSSEKRDEVIAKAIQWRGQLNSAQYQ